MYWHGLRNRECIIGFKCRFESYHAYQISQWSHRLSARTLPFQGGKRGSIPRGSTILMQYGGHVSCVRISPKDSV